MSDRGELIINGIGLLIMVGRIAMERFDWQPPEREFPDPSLERDVQAALAPLPTGFSLAARRYKGPLGRGARIVVSGACPLLSVGPERHGDVDLGAADADDTFHFLGPRPLLRAVMNDRTRSALLHLARLPDVRPDSLRVDRGDLCIDVRRPRFGKYPPQTTDIARLAVEAAALLQEPADIPARLAANALADPEPGARLLNLRTLIQEFPGHPETQATLRAASAHRDAELRLSAAVALGADGRAVLSALARDADADDSCSARAIEALGALPLPELQPVLANALRPFRGRPGPSRPFTARACIDVLAGHGERAVPLLAEPLHCPSEAVALAAVRALVRIGAVSAVLPLKDAAGRAKGAVRVAAARAVDDIQSGLERTPGALMLADGETGQVSVADNPHGHVSLPESAAAGGRTTEVS